MVTYFISIFIIRKRKKKETIKRNMTNKNQISGIHHVTAICSKSTKNIDFYTKLLGLRLVKLTVNFDDWSHFIEGFKSH
jgi:hypothetical protein